jgi:D-inositol-3-phosphate glycosyltransferase
MAKSEKMSTGKRLKVLFVSEYYLPHVGGAEVLFANLAEALAREGCDCHVVTSMLPNAKKYERIKGVKVHRVRVPRKGARYWFTFLSIPTVIMTARRVDLIHTTTYNAAFPAWLASKLLRKKAIITVHEVWRDMWVSLSEMNYLKAILHRILEKVIVGLPFDRTICVSKYTRDCLKSMGISDNRLKVIYNGIDNDLFAPRQRKNRVREKLNLLEGEFAYLYYGRPGVSKGVEYLVRAVSLISEIVPNSKLLLILANDPRDRYENIKKMIKDLKIEGRVILLDPVRRTELPDYITASDCVVIPSLSEGFGFSAAEACALGKPIVASNVASIPEVVSGRCVLVEPGSPEAIAEGVEKVYKGEWQHSENRLFSWDECVDNYRRVYEQLLGREP